MFECKGSRRNLALVIGFISFKNFAAAWVDVMSFTSEYNRIEWNGMRWNGME